MPTNRLYLVRHGENLANITLEFSHRKVDYSLNKKGVLQAQQTADYFLDKDIHEIYSSPLKRALETARIIGGRLGLQVTTLDNFMEIDAGDLEDRPPTPENWFLYMNILKDWYTGKPETAFPGGEDYFALRQRARQGFRQVVEGKSGRNIVIVGHGGIFSTSLLDLCRNFSPTDLRDTEYANCAISEIELALQDGELQGELVRWGYCAHLSGAAAEQSSLVPESLRRRWQSMMENNA
jgi:broad specificity phosphatase PhoE